MITLNESPFFILVCLKNVFIGRFSPSSDTSYILGKKSIVSPKHIVPKKSAPKVHARCDNFPTICLIDIFSLEMTSNVNKNN